MLHTVFVIIFVQYKHYQSIDVDSFIHNKNQRSNVNNVDNVNKVSAAQNKKSNRFKPLSKRAIG